EIALSLVLLAGAGLLLKSFLRLMQVDPGFRPENVLTMRISLPDARYPKPEQIRRFYQQALDRVSKLPGVVAAGIVYGLPLSGQGASGTVTVDTRAVRPEDTTPEADWKPASPGYFKALRIPLIRGRYFDERDNESAAPVAIIDETMAKTYWPTEDAVGKRIKRGGGPNNNSPWMTIVGVVRHVRYRTLEAQSRVALYWPHAQTPFSSMSLALRTSGDPHALAATAQREILAVDPDQPVY